MLKEIKVIDEVKQTLRVTTVDERWYTRPGVNVDTGLPEYVYYPSCTWIAGHYPKGIHFYKWLAEKGWNEAEALKNAGGVRGGVVHQALEIIEKSRELPISTLFTDIITGYAKEMTPEILDCIISFQRWHDEVLPELLASELTVFNEKHKYAGTLDRIYRINGQIWILDFKTSQYIWEEMKLQISSYSHSDIDYLALGITSEEWASRKLAILQLGRSTKEGYKFVPVEDKFDLFLMAYAIWKNENPKTKPKQRDYPLTIKLKEKEKCPIQPDSNDSSKLIPVKTETSSISSIPA